MNVCNQYIVGILVCLRLIALPVYADEAPESTTGATLHSKIKMKVMKQTCGDHIEAVSGVNFGMVNPKELQVGSNKREFYIKVYCDDNQGFFNFSVEPRNGILGSEEDGVIAVVNSRDQKPIDNIAIRLTWRSTSFDSQIQMDSPLKLNSAYYFDKLNAGSNEIRIRAQLVSWPLNTLIPFQGYLSITSRIIAHLTYY